MCKLIIIERIIHTKQIALNTTVQFSPGNALCDDSKKFHEFNFLAWAMGRFYRSIYYLTELLALTFICYLEENACGQPNLEQFFTHLRACLKGH